MSHQRPELTEDTCKDGSDALGEKVGPAYLPNRGKQKESAERGRKEQGQEGAGKVSKNHDSLFGKQSFMNDNSHERETD